MPTQIFLAASLLFCSMEIPFDTPPSPTAETRDESTGEIDLEGLPPERRFDFLVGDWVTTSPGSPSWMTKVRRTLMGQVLTMESTGALTQFVYAEHLGLWKATFLSPLGDHDVLEGKCVEGAMVLEQSVVRDRPEAIARTTFRDVTPTRFYSDFMSSEDGGETWTTEFTMLYVRTSTDSVPKPTAPPEAVRLFEFTLGTWDLDYTIRQADGTQILGVGIGTATLDLESRSILERTHVLFDTWISLQASSRRSWGAAGEPWTVHRSSNHAPGGVRATVEVTEEGIVEVYDTPGGIRERVVYTQHSEDEYEMRADQLFEDGSVAAAGVWTVRARRMGP